MSFGGMLTGGDEEAPKKEKTVKVDTKTVESKELANNTKIVE